MPSLAHKRGTRAQINAAATANGLRTGEVYLITDEGRLTVGTAVNAHTPAAKQSEIGGNGSSNPRASALFYSDFVSKNAYQPPFDGAAISTGTNSTLFTGAAVDANHPGIWLLRSSATANSGYRCMSPAELKLAGGEVCNLVFKTVGAFTNVTFRFGFHDATTVTDAVDGVYVEFAGSGVLNGKTANNSVRSTTAAPIATLVANTWYHVRITLNSNATLATFELFSDAGALLGSQTLATNIPTASGREVGCGFVVTHSGTVATDLLMVDYLEMKIARALQRGNAT